ncbi:hypothetical protein OF83DRAFT_1170223 [Amylostereum chailletii]|nr:hypothetical protein OF83DRAFT_1170223 [Amylostereum chailletii]
MISLSPLPLRSLSSIRTVTLAGVALVVVFNLFTFASLSGFWSRVQAVWPWTESDSLEDVIPVVPVVPPTGNYYISFTPEKHPVLDIHPPTRQEPSLACLENVIADGAQCGRREKDTQLDVLWTWVNSSDPVWRYTHTRIEDELNGSWRPSIVDWDAPIAHLQNFDELRYSIRSVLRHFRRHARRFNVLASDFAIPPGFPGTYPESTARLGQVPQWLDPRGASDTWSDGDVQLTVHHHSAYFDPYTDTTSSSFGIESQLRNLKGVADVFIYLNDDMYFLKDLHPADFYTTNHGFVLRVQPWIMIPSSIDPHPVRGEWQPLRQTNVWLSARFGTSQRPYMGHLAKTFSLTILREIAATWPEAYLRTGLRQMRKVWYYEPGDVHTVFIFGHFLVERWREALLWSWVIGKMGTDDDLWDSDIAWHVLGGGTENDSEISVSYLNRKTLDATRILRAFDAAGYDYAGDTQYVFDSGDGYPYNDIRKGGSDMPTIHPESGQMCTLSREECFPRDITHASDFFNHVTFVNPSCGDCLISHLVRLSGETGLSAFLPPPDRVVEPSLYGAVAETLPLVPKWQMGDFTLCGVLAQGRGPVSVREWMLHVLNRYRFVIGTSDFRFLSINSEEAAERVVDEVENSDAALLCMNDDLEADDRGEKVLKVLHDWQQRRWPDAPVWEREGES